ncbi:MAG TPA: S41 family peptidase [Gammaproteobacteria bacterium]
MNRIATGLRWLLVLTLASGMTDAMAAEESPPPAHAPEAVRADLDELYATLKAAHYDLFARRDREAYDREYLATRERIDEPMSEADVRKVFQRFVAFGNVAHAQIPLPFAAYREFVHAGGRIVPFGIRVMDARVFIATNSSGIAALQPGVEIVGIDGLPALEWLAERERHISADHPPLAHGLMEFWLDAITWLEFGERDALSVAVRDAEGGTTSITVPFRTLEDIRAARATQPPGLETDFNAREMKLLDDGIAYLRPGPFYNTSGGKTWDETEFRAFIDDAFTKILAAKATDLVIDLRNNPGGDQSFSDLLVAWIADRPFQFYSTFRFKVSEPTRKAILQRAEDYADMPENLFSVLKEMAALVRGHENGERVALEIDAASPHPAPRFEGRVWAIINRHSYSNATAVAALLQDYGFATLLGEPTHDLPSSYGAAESFTLSRTGIEVHYPKSWFVRPNGDARLRGVQPDIAIATPVIETQEDAVLAKVVEHIRQPQLR